MASVTYWMNRLQNLDPAFPLFVSLNPIREPDPASSTTASSMPIPASDRMRPAPRRTIQPLFQGRNRTWFAGAYLGYGFHEDGLQSGFNVAAALGSPPPWFDKVVPMSSSLPPLAPVVT